MNNETKRYGKMEGGKAMGKFYYETNRTGIRFFQMYPRDFVWLLRLKCMLIGHMGDYDLMIIRKATAWWNFSPYRYTCGHCTRCGLGWQDWKYFPYGRGFSENDEAGVEHARE